MRSHETVPGDLPLLVFIRQLHFLALICVYNRLTLAVSLLLKNRHAGKEPDNCLTRESLFWCAMATRFLFWTSVFIPFLSLYAVEDQGCPIVVEILLSERYMGERENGELS